MQYKRRGIEIVVHVVTWIILFIFPILLEQSSGSRVMHPPMHYVVLYLSFLVVFYSNYLLLIKKLLFERRILLYVIINVVLVVVVCMILQHLHEVYKPMFHSMNETLALPPNHKPPRYGKIINDLLSLFMFVGLSVILRMIMRWYELEERNRVLEQERAEVELKNLKHQLNPHFIFNTLNNIYALIAINGDKAQQAVLELSNMLRYILYENKSRYVLVAYEIKFIRNYMELMSLRQNKQTRVSITINTELCDDKYIAPLLFIPLIENAFKHGVNPMGNSYIDISIVALDSHIIECKVSNSRYPQRSIEERGSGIGLDNLQRQLQLLYPDNYTLKFDITDEQYTVVLTINLNSI